MSQSNQTEQACAAIRNNSPANFSWTWDEHSQAVLLQINIQDSGTAQSLLMRGFNQEWTDQQLETMPDKVRHLANTLGGLRSGQKLFTCSPEAEPVLYATWWPWGNKTTISVRIGCLVNGKRTSIDAIRTTFGV